MSRIATRRWDAAEHLKSETDNKALSPQGDPGFATILKVIEALALRLHAAPARSAA